MILLSQHVLEAEFRIRDHIRETPLDYSFTLSSLADCNVYLKLEQLQHTGSFKIRGAMNKILTMTPDQLQQGVIAASTGNHGIGVCYAARAAGTEATIYLPREVAESKIAIMKHLGAHPIATFNGCLEAEVKARDDAGRRGKIFISPYNDLEVIAGQGTIGVEVARQIDRIDAAFIAVGGGGLIAGVARYLKSINPEIRIVGCWPEKSPVMYECIRAGRIVEVPEEPTISESTAGGLEEGSITFPLCQQLISEHVLVSESEIRTAMRITIEKDGWMIEGSAGVAVAAFLKVHKQYAGQNVVIILCGRNLPPDRLKEILDADR